ncbi:metal ABC transporter substrate-binding protein [Cellulomonas sp. zg-Y338]|uniref:Metal ABC transporter substrate-binding protein n=2 Tax=Cellulomonas chengniuliangii TaxID=2968084 RepID=A0ABY5L3M3_9CELL|nr:metal ABC transporter substrate-binding protein [Cellulomonas chengniuliangii]MCC2308000.1 metal ABC transporter substrate-binding protein [Cellulomonas chengniuliangii]UUI76404.1 metal ABC transporter substrate-binding protein [Cellulomonas chengniuliangii]
MPDADSGASMFGVPNFYLRGPTVLVAAVLATLLLTGCAGSSGRSQAAGPTGSEHDDRPVVLATFTVIADMARVVAGDHLRVESVTKAGAEIHGYEPTPDDLRRAANADLVLDNGLGLEAWFDKFIDRLDAPHATLSDGVDTIPITGGESRGHANPHAWMSPAAAQVYVANTAAAFAALDPENAADYRANAEAYAAQIADLGAELERELAALEPSRRALVTCEGAFSYLARDAGLAEAWLWPVNSERQGTPQQVASTIDFVRDNQVPAVFCESTVSSTAQEQVAEEAGARFAGVLYVDSLSESDGPVPTYLELLAHGVRTIIAGLTGVEDATR